VKLARFRRPKATCFLSYMEYSPNTNTSNIIERKRERERKIQSTYPKVGLIEETKGGGKEGKNNS
jgi:hypothetical protein